VHLANLVRLARVEEDALGRGGLAGIDVRHDADVAVHGQVHVALGGGRRRHAHRRAGRMPRRKERLHVQALHQNAGEEDRHDARRRQPRSSCVAWKLRGKVFPPP